MGVSKASYWHGSFIDVWQQTSCVDRRLAKDKAGGSTGGGWLPVDFFFFTQDKIFYISDDTENMLVFLPGI